MTILFDGVGEFDAEEVVDGSVEIDLKISLGWKDGFKCCFDRWIGAEVDEVIYIDADI